VWASVQDHYGQLAEQVRAGLGDGPNACCGRAGCCATAPAETPPGPGFYAVADLAELPPDAVAASLGCGNPTVVADLLPGEFVLDLGSGGGIDVILSARRVGAAGRAYGLDMTEKMLDLARENARQAGAANAEFLKGHIEQIPLPDAAVDVIISNCVVNLSPDKDRVLREAFRVLRPGGRLAISDVVIRDGGPNELDIPFEVRRSVELWSGCIAGALTESKYLRGMRAAGFTAPEVQEVRRYRADDIGASFRRTLRRQGILGHQAADAVAGRFMSAIVRATKPK